MESTFYIASENVLSYFTTNIMLSVLICEMSL